MLPRRDVLGAPPMQTNEAREYWRCFKPSACILKLQGKDRAAVFGELVDNFVKVKLLDAALRDRAVEAFLAREGLATTGVGQNVAVPHVKLSGLEEAIFSISIHPEGVAWDAPDGAPVNLVFAVLRPARPGDRFDPERHLDMMRWISGLARGADFRRFAQRVSKRSDLIDLMREMSGA
jgi:PTS system nitrogen regulatory IIA component